MPFRRHIAKLALLLALMAVPSASPGEDLHGVALVIGQSRYDGLQELPNTVRDARAMDGLLGDLGFDVTRVLDADGEDLREAVAEFLEDATGSDLALVYYAGHGVEAAGQNFLVPTDASSGDPATLGASLLPAGDLIEQLSQRTKVAIVLLDACRTSAFPPGQQVQFDGGAQPVAVAQAGLQIIRGPTVLNAAEPAATDIGTLIGFAASPGQPAMDGPEGGNSPYAAALLKHLAAGGYSLGDVMTMVTEEVYLKTGARQLPWTNSSLRRILNFGQVGSDIPEDEAAIRDGRRRLLLSMTTVPEATRRYVEQLAGSEQLSLDVLYGVLRAIVVESGVDAGAVNDELLDGARRLKALLETGTPEWDDAELSRLAQLAASAEAEGALDVALTFRTRAADRATALSAARRQSDADRVAESQALYRQYAETHAQAARAALKTFDFRLAATEFAAAFHEVADFDRTIALGYKHAEANALRELGRFAGDNDALFSAIAAYAEAQAIATPGSAEDIAIRNGLGVAQYRLGARQSQTELLEAGIETLQGVTAALSPTTAPREWGQAQADLAAAIWRLAERRAGIEGYSEAAVAYRASLDVLSREHDAFLWARAENGLGLSLWRLGARTDDSGLLLEAVAALRQAQTVWRLDTTPVEWGLAQINIVGVFGALAQQEDDTGFAHEAIDAANLAALALPRDRYPLYWATSLHNKGNIQVSTGITERSEAMVEDGIATLRQVVEERTRDLVPLDWARTQLELGRALIHLGLTRDDEALLTEAVGVLTAALEESTIERAPTSWLNTQVQLVRATMGFARLTHSVEAWQAAVTAARPLGAAPADLAPGDELAWGADQLSIALMSLGKLTGDGAYLAESAEFAEQARIAYLALGRDRGDYFERRMTELDGAR